MDGFFILGFFMIVVGIPVIVGVWGDVYKRRLAFREREMELMSQQTAEKAARFSTISLRNREMPARSIRRSMV